MLKYNNALEEYLQERKLVFYEMMEFRYNSFMNWDWEGCSSIHLLVLYMYTFMYHECNILLSFILLHTVLNFLEGQSVIGA